MGQSESKPPIGENYLRAASPNERRCIVRESLGFYRALVVGGIYEFVEPVEMKSLFTYTYALRQCIESHPQLSITVAKSETESPCYLFCPRLDLSHHVQFFERGGEKSEIKTIQQILPSILDAPWPRSIPAWKIVVLPLSQRRCFFGFSFSHTMGDGISGIAFHRTFINALQEKRLEKDLVCIPTLKQLSPVFDTAENLPISWSFLLSPLLGAYLPEGIASLFGFRAALGSIPPSTWTGSSVFYDPKTYRTGVEILSIDAKTVGDALKICRKHGAKLTGLIHQLIINALLESLPQPNKFDTFAAGTAMNLRHLVGVSKDEMGNFISGDFETHKIQRPPSETMGEFSWVWAKSITEKLAKRANDLHDQPIGLLRYLSNIRPWMLSKLGSRRDCSYELSNLISFQPSGSLTQCSVTDMVFCQPGDATGAPLSFNIVSAPNGLMNIAVSWQIGALDLGSDEDEVDFVRTVCQKIGYGFDMVSLT